METLTFSFSKKTVLSLTFCALLATSHELNLSFHKWNFHSWMHERALGKKLVHKIQRRLSPTRLGSTKCLSDIPNMTWEYKMLFSPRAGFLHPNSKYSINSSTTTVRYGINTTQLSTHQSTQWAHTPTTHTSSLPWQIWKHDPHVKPGRLLM